MTSPFQFLFWDGARHFVAVGSGVLLVVMFSVFVLFALLDMLGFWEGEK